MTAASTIKTRIDNYCNVLRDDGISYGDYLEQLTYLIFLKMDDERSKPPYQMKSSIPKEYSWENFKKLDGAKLEEKYLELLKELGKKDSIIGLIYRKSQNKIQDPAKLKRLINLIDGEKWLGLDIDVKGEIYESLLQRFAEDTKSGAGQYFTPRALIKAMVEVTKPKIGEKICDPACGTGGFFLVAHDYIEKNNKNMDRDQKRLLNEKTFKGYEIVDNTARLCTMNLYLNGIGIDTPTVEVNDSLSSEPSQKFDIVLTNPPFGKKSSNTIGISKEDLKKIKSKNSYVRNDFWATTSNKQLNFLQHIKSILSINGRAAVVLPDNVLFEGGAGETIRKKLLNDFNVHTLLRLPTGIFYAQGVKANVLFFDKKEARKEPWTEKIWIYDFRTNQNFTRKTNPLSFEDLKDFIKCYNAENINKRIETEKFKAFSYEEIVKRDKTSLDIFWLKDESLQDSDKLPEPKILVEEILESLNSALESFNEIAEELEE